MDVTNSPKEYISIAKEANFDIITVSKLLSMDENLPGLSAQRSVVQWAFNEDTDLGSIKRFNINKGYAIAQLTSRYRSGTMTVADASATALPVIRKEKKAAWIIKNKGAKTLDAFSQASGQSIETASALSVKSPTIPGAGREAFVVGKAFNLEVGGTSSLLIGETGVYLMKVTNKTDATPLDNYSTYAGALNVSNLNSVFFSSFNALKEAAVIEDFRALFY
jgi:peptidyl-prolyl cis-trans isomerase D